MTPGTKAPGSVAPGAPTTVTVAPTVATPTVPAPSVPPTIAPTTTCPGPATVPGGATNVVTISGDIDGDLQPDQVTSYTASGEAHIHATLASGRQSDIVMQLGFADSVAISFEDFDHALGAPIPPPVAVLAVGAGSAGSAHIAFVTLTTQYCLKQWTLHGNPFSIRLSQQDPYTGLVCDGAAGHIHYDVVTAMQQGDGTWAIERSTLTHNFTKVTVTPLDSLVVADSPTIAHEYGDIVNCDHPPLFP